MVFYFQDAVDFQDAVERYTSKGELAQYLSHLLTRELLRTQNPVQRSIGCGGGGAVVRTA